MGRKSTGVSRAQKVLAVCSPGGHWVQLMQITSAFEGHEVAYATAVPEYKADVPDARFYTFKDASRWNKFGLLRTGAALTRIILAERPDVIVSTGAAPGFLALTIGRAFGARTVWIDSMANVCRLSMSGQYAGRHADLWLTQWPHLAKASGPNYVGAVI